MAGSSTFDHQRVHTNFHCAAVALVSKRDATSELSVASQSHGAAGTFCGSALQSTSQHQLASGDAAECFLFVLVIEFAFQLFGEA